MSPRPSQRRTATVSVLLLLLAVGEADVAFEPEIGDKFLESSETPLKSIKQRGSFSGRIKGVLSIKRTAKDADESKPIVHIMTAPDCSACDKLKREINKGSPEMHSLLSEFDVVYLNGPRASWTDKWHELGHESYVPQVGPNRCQSVVPMSWSWHTCTHLQIQQLHGRQPRHLPSGRPPPAQRVRRAFERARCLCRCTFTHATVGI
jgi:hypothetical protein